MEELLNKLIEKGWKPFGNKEIVDCKTAEMNINLLNEEVNKVSKFKDKVAFTNSVLIFDEINLRELVSKESWLWQFVCENGIIEDEHYCWDWYTHWDENWRIEIRQKDYRYRLIQSALCDENKLEDFILSNIVIKDD